MHQCLGDRPVANDALVTDSLDDGAHDFQGDIFYEECVELSNEGIQIDSSPTLEANGMNINVVSQIFLGLPPSNSFF